MKLTGVFAATALAVALASPASADVSAKGFVKKKQNELTALLKQESPSASKRIEAIFDRMLDYDSLARQSLDEHWKARSDEEREEFQNVLKQLVQRAYKRNLHKTIDYAVRFEGQAKSAERYVVQTVAKSKTDAREEPISIDYVVRRVDGRWRVQDIVTEGSSLVKNYRRQFHRLIRDEGFDELMRRMKRKLAEG